MRKVSAGIVALLLACAGGAGADPVSSRTENVLSAVIDGSIQIGPRDFISYRITLTRSSGEYLVSTTKSPQAAYRSVKACISFTSDFFSDSGCTTSSKFSQPEDLSRSSGRFIAKLRNLRAKVKVAFTVSGTGTTTETPVYSYNASQPSTSAKVQAGQWFERRGKPKGTVEVVGYPRTSIRGASARLARGSGISAAADA